jgi:MFS family permease
LILGTIITGAVLLGLLVLVEVRKPAPMIDMMLFKDRLFRSSCLVLALGSAAFLGLLFLVALFFQDGLGLSALQSGVSTFPEALGVMLGAQAVTRLLYPVLGPRRVMIAGLLILSLTLALMTLIGRDTSLWWMRLLLFVSGYGMAHVFVPSQAAGFATISPADTARASTLFNAQRQLGGAVGVALLSSVVAAVGPVRFVSRRAVPNLASYHTAFLVAAGVAVIAAVAALTVKDSDAAHTMVRRGRNRVHTVGEDPTPAVPATA